jgi:hypothetical protein
MLPRVRNVSSLALCCLVLAARSTFAFTDESLGAPKDGERVSSETVFYIEADGHPEALELYRIEIASDSGFEKIVRVVDMAKNMAGWSLGDARSLDKIPEDQRPKNFEGIHLRVHKPLPDGTYFWRASKSANGGPYQEIKGVESFVVDSTPPEPVDTLRVRMLEDGRVQVYWSSVTRDAAGEQETAEGYRVYRYTKVLKRFPIMTRNLAAETKDTQAVFPGREDTAAITFYFVNGVDLVGNEAGRKRPVPLGGYEVAFNPPNLNQLTNPKYLKRLAQQEKAAEEKAAAEDQQ